MTTAPTTQDTTVITEPGVYELTAEEYHADPVAGGSLSNSGAKKILPPSCPAKFRHWQLHGQEPKPEFDIGHAAHKLVLGVGVDIARIDADDLRTKVAKEAMAAARAEGKTPLKAKDYDMVHAMAATLKQHPAASQLFLPGTGTPEQVIAWQDDESGVWCRAMVDWHQRLDDGRLLVVDYKTSTAADPDGLPGTVHKWGYYQQHDWYLTGATAVGLGDDPQFIFVFQEKEPPYLVTCAQLDDESVSIGHTRNRKARELYRRCTEADYWPGYADQVISISLPGWATYRHHQAAENGDYDTAYEENIA